MKKFALIVAGGSGSRMRQAVPKQFTELAGKPILMHTFNAFIKYDPEIEFVLVLPEDQMDQWKLLCKKYRFNVKYKLAKGGETRFQSVKNGLELVPGEGIVFIHDGVRPMVSLETIENCYQMALKKGNALPVVPVTESLRTIDGNSNKAVNRSQYLLVQTPQTFSSVIIKRAYSQSSSSSFTDDASVLEQAGHAIHLVEGNRDNIKITYPEDFTLAKVLLENKMKNRD
ncbi:MAG TPA: 2-C-methyl-D-erythritol 4-phosphate cytidylyltransferase [Draconibacterium sp.]|nr:2-C-methyl-D-erythritol 4-phosphate cytidylyltransferase [Draconibacterium sp.]